MRLAPGEGDESSNLSDLRVYYRHTECGGCDNAWIIEKWTTNYIRRKRDAARVEDWSAWRPLSPFCGPLAAVCKLIRMRYQHFDIGELRVTDIHTGHWIVAGIVQ